MEKYLVVKVWKFFSPTVVAQFDNKEDAVAYASLSKKTDSENNYAVCVKDYTTEA